MVLDLNNMLLKDLRENRAWRHQKYLELNANAPDPFGLPREKAAAIAREINAAMAELDAVEAAIKQHPQHLANRHLANRHL